MVNASPVPSCFGTMPELEHLKLGKGGALNGPSI